MSALVSLQSWWLDLGPRDRRALRYGGIVAGLLAGVFVLWSVSDLLAARRAALESSRALTSSAADRIAVRLGAGADLSADGGDAATLLQTRVTRGVERAGLAADIVTVQTVAPGRVQLVLRDAPFDALVALAGSLARWEGITVVGADITRSRPGRVEATLLLRAP